MSQERSYGSLAGVWASGELLALVVEPGAEPPTVEAGLRVVACSDPADAYTMIRQSVRTDDPVIGGVLVTARDVTDRLHAEAEARRRDEVERAPRLRAGQRLGLAVEQRFGREGGAMACALGLAGRIAGLALPERPSPLISRCICSGH